MAQTQRNIRPREPMFNFSEKAPVWLAGFLIIVHVVVYYGPASLSNTIADWGVLRALGANEPSILKVFIRVLTHGFLHGSWGHVLMNSGMIIVFGIATIRGARMFRLARGRSKGASTDFVQVFLFGVIIGGLAQLLWWMIAKDVDGGALGASGGASALFATTAWAIGGKQRLISFGLGWAVINVVMVVAGPVLGVNLAWAAHMGGYLAGAMLAPFMIRPNSAKIGI